MVSVLTDGSGSSGSSRAHRTTDLLARTGARPAPVFCPLSDRNAYTALMARDPEPFIELCDRIARLLLDAPDTTVVVDAAEGYNPVHDVCHWVGRAATARARAAGAYIDVYELDLVGHPNGQGDGIRLTLDDRALARKLAAVDCYALLANEAAAAFDRYGRDAFRTEFLRHVDDELMPVRQAWVPHYEEVGEARVRAGTYSSVLRYGDHVKPVVETLLDFARSSPYAEDLGTFHQ